MRVKEKPAPLESAPWIRVSGIMRGWGSRGEDETETTSLSFSKIYRGDRFCVWDLTEEKVTVIIIRIIFIISQNRTEASSTSLTLSYPMYVCVVLELDLCRSLIFIFSCQVFYSKTIIPHVSHKTFTDF